jgi:hypothetical protein
LDEDPTNVFAHIERAKILEYTKYDEALGHYVSALKVIEADCEER